MKLPEVVQDVQLGVKPPEQDVQDVEDVKDGQFNAASLTS